MGQNKPINFGLHVNNQKKLQLFISLSTCHNMPKKNYRSEKLKKKITDLKKLKKNYRSEKIKNYLNF